MLADCRARHPAHGASLWQKAHFIWMPPLFFTNYQPLVGIFCVVQNLPYNGSLNWMNVGFVLKKGLFRKWHLCALLVNTPFVLPFFVSFVLCLTMDYYQLSQQDTLLNTSCCIWLKFGWAVHSMTDCIACRLPHVFYHRAQGVVHSTFRSDKRNLV